MLEIVSENKMLTLEEATLFGEEQIQTIIVKQRSACHTSLDTSRQLICNAKVPKDFRDEGRARGGEKPLEPVLG